MVIGYIFPVLVCCTKKNLATLDWTLKPPTLSLFCVIDFFNFERRRFGVAATGSDGSTSFKLAEQRQRDWERETERPTFYVYFTQIKTRSDNEN
jgi:hypothetical protein